MEIILERVVTKVSPKRFHVGKNLSKVREVSPRDLGEILPGRGENKYKFLKQKQLGMRKGKQVNVRMV